MGYSKEIINQIKSLPSTPGIYIFRAADSSILYVGKAKNLKKRVNSYLIEPHNDWKLKTLSTHATSLEVQTVKSELDALVLEARLIQNLKPKLNIKLKNNNPFVYFYFSDKKPLYFELTRKSNKAGTFFGPFLNKRIAQQIFDLLSTVFGLRKCSRKIKNGCLYFHMNQCAGFCTNSFDENSYKQKLKLAQSFLKDGPKKFINFLIKQINTFNKNLCFEQSAIYSRYLKTIYESKFDLQNISSMKQLLNVNQESQHIWLINEDAKILLLLEHKNGHVSKKMLLHLKEYESYTLDEVLTNYYRDNIVPLIIFINFQLKDADLITKFLQKWHNLESLILIEKIQEQNPSNQIVIDLAFELLRQESNKDKNLAVDLQKILLAKKPIHTIDCFDISHHQELFIVASCVRFQDETPDTKFYKCFKIKSTVTPNDYLSLREAVYRRYVGIADNLPDLVLIDGGKGQLNAVQSLFPQLLFASLAKREETLIRRLPNSSEKKYVEIKLNLKNPIGHLLTNIRNHAHNFAIKFHRKLKTKISS